MTHRCSIYCVVPPVVLDRIARNGTDEQRGWALDTLARDQSIRAARIQGAVQRAAAPKTLEAFWPQEGGQPNRTIFNASNGENVAGEIARREGDAPTGDEAVDEAYDGLGATYECLWDVFERHSLDDAGMPLNAVVHFGQNYDNAFWDGQRMVFGDGDGSLFTRFTRSLDVIGHELGHGVVEDEAGLNYWQQSGALNESVADVLGTLVKQHKLGQTVDQADWLVGAEILGPDVEGQALRSLAAPGTAFDDDVLGKDPQPAHIDQYVETTADNGGVHINSGIPNHAFYTAAMALGGRAWERAGWIWYAALRDPRVKPTARFLTFARATIRAARRMYGDAGEEVRAVKDGWAKVGIAVD
jgi:Zn-dependent metalloprotease